MKLTNELIAKIQNITQTAQLVGIDSVIIEKDAVRAIDDEKTVLIFHGDTNDIPFDAIALNRLSLFASRLELAKSGAGFEVEAITDDAKEYAKSLVMKNKKSKIDYRCANPSVIKAPRQIQDTMKYQVTLTPEIVNTLAKAATAMGSDCIEISATEDTAKFEMSDMNKDAFSLDITGNIKSIKNGTLSFKQKYPIKVLIALFKKSPDSTFNIGENGLLNIIVNDINVFVLPQV